jgi:hypothetical protein
VRKRVQKRLAVLLIAILAGASWAIFHEREPVYRGHTLRYWLHQYNTPDTDRFRPADEAIRSIGTNALPSLLSDLKWSESATVASFYSFCLRHPWIKLPLYGEDHSSGAALMALRALGSEASPILPELAKLLEDSRTAERAAQAFFLIGPASIPMLEEVCRNTNVATRVQAALLIAVMESKEIGYAFGSHRAPMNGKPVLSVGWGFGGRAERTISRLVEGLHSQDPTIRRANLDALRSIASAVSNPVPSSLMTWVEGVSEDVNAAREAVKQADAEAVTESRVR